MLHARQKIIGILQPPFSRLNNFVTEKSAIAYDECLERHVKRIRIAEHLEALLQISTAHQPRKSLHVAVPLNLWPRARRWNPSLPLIHCDRFFHISLQGCKLRFVRHRR